MVDLCNCSFSGIRRHDGWPGSDGQLELECDLCGDPEKHLSLTVRRDSRVVRCVLSCRKLREFLQICCMAKFRTFSTGFGHAFDARARVGSEGVW